MINDIITEYCWALNEEKERAYKEKEHKRRLWMSNLGSCIRKAYFDMDGAEKTHPFDKLLIRKFRAGSDEEDKTAAAFMHRWPGSVVRDMPVGNSIWSGKIDILVAQNEDFPLGAIIENKGTSPYGMKKGMIPRLQHCYQVLAYQKFLKSLVEYDVPAYLYYRCWDFYAQFEITDHKSDDSQFLSPGIEYVGDINGREYSGGYDEELDQEIEWMEHHWGCAPMDTPGYDSPFTESFACTKSSRRKNWKQINCLYFSHCWAEHAERAGEDRLLEVE